jgi:hypothetical protein
MQMPTMKTPVSKCVELAAGSGRMLSKFTGNLVLAQLAARMSAAGQELDAAQQRYVEAVKAILPTRIDVRYENYRSDKRIRRTQTRIEEFEDKKGGRISKAVFPEGTPAITRLQGQSQVDAMILLEGRLAAAVKDWAGASTEQADIAQHRQDYGAAVQARTKAGQDAAAVRAQRDAEKQTFITTYAEIQHRVEAEFPDDKAMQELFFDDVRTASSSAQADGNAGATTEEADAKTGDAPAAKTAAETPAKTEPAAPAKTEPAASDTPAKPA